MSTLQVLTEKYKLYTVKVFTLKYKLFTVQYKKNTFI